MKENNGNPKRKKIFYVPGIISLAIIPLIFSHYAQNAIQVRSITTLPIFMADTSLFSKFPELFARFDGHIPPRRNYLDIIITGSNPNDEIKLDFVRVRVKEMISQNDLLNGIHFKFQKTSRFGAYVRVIDLLRSEGAKTFMPLNDDIWFYNLKPDTLTKAVQFVKQFEKASHTFQLEYQFGNDKQL